MDTSQWRRRQSVSSVSVIAPNILHIFYTFLKLFYFGNKHLQLTKTVSQCRRRLKSAIAWRASPTLGVWLSPSSQQLLQETFGLWLYQDGPPTSSGSKLVPHSSSELEALESALLGYTAHPCIEHYIFSTNSFLFFIEVNNSTLFFFSLSKDWLKVHFLWIYTVSSFKDLCSCDIFAGARKLVTVWF